MNFWADVYAYYNFNYVHETPDAVTPSCESPEDVRVYHAAWVSNATTVKMLGPCHSSIEGEMEIDEALEELEKRCKKDAFYFGANAITNFTCDLYLWDNPRIYKASGHRCVLRFNG